MIVEEQSNHNHSPSSQTLQPAAVTSATLTRKSNGPGYVVQRSKKAYDSTRGSMVTTSASKMRTDNSMLNIKSLEDF